MRKSPAGGLSIGVMKSKLGRKLKVMPLLDSLVSRDYFLSAMGYLGNSRTLMQRISFNPLIPVSSGAIVLYRKFLRCI